MLLCVVNVNGSVSLRVSESSSYSILPTIHVNHMLLAATFSSL